MQLRIENIGPVGSAIIDLTGLTVIGGLNDTGKSTIGKIYFAIVKAIRNKDQEHASVQRSKINAIVSELTSELRKIYGARITPSSLQAAVRTISEINIPSDSLQTASIARDLAAFRSQILGEINRKVYRSNADEEEIAIMLSDEGNGALESIDRHINRIRTLLTGEKESKSIYADSFANIMSSIFRNEVNNKRLNEKGSIVLFENDNEVFSATFERNQLISFEIDENAINEFFNDATILESPMVLNYSSFSFFFTESYNTFSFGDYPAHDLIRKIRLASNSSASADSAGVGLEAEISSMIAEAINGTIAYDAKQSEFVYSTGDIQVKIGNTASGVKSLGIMQMLARIGFFSDNPLFIVDEPEVHLHPAWQLVSAKVIATLVSKYNVYCLVSSHSPYFLQAIEEYTRLYEMENLTKFYVSNKSKEGVCLFKDVTSNTEPLYDLLAEPMQKIAYLQTKEPNNHSTRHLDE